MPQLVRCPKCNRQLRVPDLLGTTARRVP